MVVDALGGFLGGWCTQRLGSSVSGVLFEAGNLSRVVGLTLADGRRVVAKARPWLDRLGPCAAVQGAVAAAGYPCPRVLAGPDRVDGQAISVEELLPGRSQLVPGAEAAAQFAELLARLTALTDAVGPLGPLVRSSPPWVGWDHPGDQLWPERDTPGAGLNEHDGPDWVDSAAAGARSLLRAADLPVVLGHGDWESQNLRWVAGKAHAVHDWDSLIAQPEPAVVGAAAAVWPAGQLGRAAASVEESESFLEAYVSASGARWNRDHYRLAWAAGLWTRAFNAKKDATDGGGVQLDLLADEIDQRTRNAGL